MDNRLIRDSPWLHLNAVSTARRAWIVSSCEIYAPLMMRRRRMMTDRAYKRERRKEGERARDVELRAKSGTNTGSSLSCTPRAGCTHRDTAGAPFHHRAPIPPPGARTLLSTAPRITFFIRIASFVRRHWRKIMIMKTAPEARHWISPRSVALFSANPRTVASTNQSTVLIDENSFNGTASAMKKKSRVWKMKLTIENKS